LALNIGLTLKTCFSNLTNVGCSVPQSSVLGPLLFLICMNVSDCSVNKGQHRLIFADDTILFMSGSNIHDIMRVTEESLLGLSVRFKNNMLTLNVDKTFYSIFFSAPKLYQTVYLCVCM